MLDFHERLIDENGVLNATGFTEHGQLARFRVLHGVLLEECARFPDLDLTVLDYGCAAGDFYAYLNAHHYGYRTRYTGIDANTRFIAAAQSRFAGCAARWSTGNILDDGTRNDLMLLRPDIVVASGVLCLASAAATFDTLIHRLYTLTARTLVINMLVQPPEGYPHKPGGTMVRWTTEDALRQCRLLSCNAWNLLHGYLPNDMTLVLRKEFSCFR